MSPARTVPGRRVLVLVLFLLPLLGLSRVARGQNVLALMQHDQAWPNVAAADFAQSEWIRWAPEQPNLNNRVLSLATGLDLGADPADFGFESTSKGWKAKNERSLEARGFFRARRDYLGTPSIVPLHREYGTVSPSVLMLALTARGQTLAPLPFDGPLPKVDVLVVETKNWNEVAELGKRVGGRVLVIEYPPEGHDPWSRFWTWGKGWPEGVPVETDLRIPGLVRGSRALALLQRPETFAWRPNEAGRWGGPKRWLEHGDGTAPNVLAGAFGLALFVVAWALAQVMNEDRGPFVSELLVVVALLPAALVLSGAGASRGGLDAWPIVLPLALVLLYGASWSLTLALGRTNPETHPLWAPCAIGLAAFVVCDPLWSDFSGRFGGLDLDVPGVALGAFLAYLTGMAAFARGRWPGRAAVAALLLWGVTGHPWWVDGHSALLVVPAIALIAAEGLFRPVLLPILALLPTGLLRIARDGVAWNPGGLLGTAEEARALNLWQTFSFLFAPPWLVLMAVLAFGLLVGNRFLAYRLSRLLRHDPRLRAIPWAAAGALALGATEPLAIPAVPVLVLSALVVLAYDGLRANA